MKKSTFYLTSLLLFVVAVVLGVHQTKVAAQYGGLAKDCSAKVDGRCLNEGFFTGEERLSSSSAIAVRYPVYTYTDSRNEATNWAYPSAADYNYAGGYIAPNGNPNGNGCNREVTHTCSAATEAFISYHQALLNSAIGPGDPNYDTDSGCYPPSGSPPSCNRELVNASAFIINSMMGVDASTFGSGDAGLTAGINNARGLFSQWATAVRSLDASGNVDWNVEFTQDPSTINTSAVGEGKHYRDITAWYQGITEQEHAIIFHSTNGAFIINRQCMNAKGFAPLDVPKPPDKPPTISVTIECDNKRAKITASDPDGSTFPVEYQIDGGGYSTVTYNNTPYYVDMSSYSQYDIHTINARTKGFIPANSTSPSGYVYAQPDPTTYGRGGSRACQDRQFTATPTANSPLLKPDDEAPDRADFYGGVYVTVNPPPNGGSPSVVRNLNISRTYYVDRGGTNVHTISSGSVTTDVSIASGSYQADNDIHINYPVIAGDKVCISITVRPTGNTIDTDGNITNNNGITSAPSIACAIIYAKPYFRTYGGDTIAGNQNSCQGWGNASIPPASPTGGIYGFNNGSGKGAASQLASIALKKIVDFTTAAGRSSSPTQPNGLTFANDTTLPPHVFGGGFNAISCPPDYFTTPPNGPFILTHNGDYSVGAFTVPKNTPQAIYVIGNIRITGNITYINDNTWTVGHIPSLAVIATGNIYIDPGVTELHGLYVAKGTIYTCGGGGAAPFSRASDSQIAGSTGPDLCNKRLNIFGGFVASQVKLLRSINSLKDGDPNEPYKTSKAAEIFMFSPEEWLTNSALPPGSSSGDYDSIASLPPIL